MRELPCYAVNGAENQDTRRTQTTRRATGNFQLDLVRLSEKKPYTSLQVLTLLIVAGKTLSLSLSPPLSLSRSLAVALLPGPSLSFL